MSILDKIEQLREKMINFRGELDTATERNIEIWHQQIRDNQAIFDCLNSKGGKLLLKDAKRMLAVVDNDLTNTSLEDREIARLLALKVAWTDIVQTLTQAPSRLEALESIIDSELK